LWLNLKGNHFSFLSKQSTSNANQKCINWLLHDSIQRGILSPSFPNNQPVVSINKWIDWLLCNSIWRNLFSLLSQESMSSINEWMHPKKLYQFYMLS